jgi:hypothetical protein
MMVGDKPGPIDNSEIEGENQGQMKSNIIVNKDIVLIPEALWRELLAWYGGGPTFERKVIMNSQSIPTIELHPPLITFILCSNTGTPLSGSEKQMFMSVSHKLSEVLLKICEQYKIISTESARLWKK